MHIEIQVALNFVISYLYNKLPRRRVNIFGEELEKALRDKFQGHWYPEKPFKGSAYRCLKTGDPIDSVVARAARESGVPISDILENLPSELSVWVDPGEVSYRIGEKGAVKILYTENNENHEDSYSADREVTKTFNPEAQCFRPIDVVNTTMNNLSLSPKAFPLPMPPSGSSPLSAASSSPTYKGSPNPNGCGSGGACLATGNNSATSAATAAAFVQRAAQAPLTFTTATFAQTKFGSTKLKTSSKRTNSSSYRMSPTEFSNYIKQRAMQQQLHHGHNVAGSASAAYGALDAVSPARSLSPNPMALGGPPNAGGGGGATATGADPFFFPNISMGLYTQYNGQRGLFEPQFAADAANLGLYGQAAAAAAAAGGNSFSTYLEPWNFANGHLNANAAAAALAAINQQQQQHLQQQQQQQQQHHQLEHANSSESCFTMDVDCSNIAVGVGMEEVANLVGGCDSLLDRSPIGTPTMGTVVSSGSLNAVQVAAPTTAAGAAATSTPTTPTLAAAAAAAVAATTATTMLANNSSSSGGGGNNGSNNSSGASNSNMTNNTNNTNNNNNNQQQQQQQDTSTVAAAASNSKLIDSINSFYGTSSSYQQLLVAN